jgi:hypothetical protein
MPKIALPLHFPGVSKRATGLPMRWNWLRCLSGGAALSGSLAAAAASCPYESMSSNRSQYKNALCGKSAPKA